MKDRLLPSFVAASATLIATLGHAGAQGAPTLTDIASCNEEAAAKTGPPSAMPGPPPRLPETAPRAPDVREGVAPSVSGPVTPRGTRTDPTGSIVTRSPDPLLEGMDAERLADPAYRAAYRDCMARRDPGR
jgi:hypothetical protein